MDSILIENLTLGGDTTLYAPDTVLVLDYATSIWDNRAIRENNFSVSQNYPNPFKEKTEVNLYLQEKEYIKITIRNILGRELAQYKNTLNSGNHSFSFYSGNQKYYLLTVTGKQTIKTIKMLNANYNQSYYPHIQCKLFCIFLHKQYYKSQKEINNFGFSIGDELQFTAYALTEIGNIGSAIETDTPESNTTYELNILGGLRCPSMPSIDDIDGNTYITVQIGDQCWMKENLKTTTYSSGTPIPNVTNAGKIGVISQQEPMFGMTMILAGKTCIVDYITGLQLLIPTAFAQRDGTYQQLMNGQY